MRKYKALIILNVLLTLGAAGTWGYVWYEDNKVETEQNEVVKRDESTKKLNENFGLKFESESLSTTPDSLTEDIEVDESIEAELSESLSADILLDGNTENVKEVLLVVSYDPNLIEVKDIVEGDLFDSYDSKEIDEALGLVKIKGTMSEAKDLAEGTFATVEFKRIKDGDTNLIVMEDDLVSDAFTTVMDFDGNKTTVKSAQVSLF